jgi:hypothetical protein
MIHCISFPCPRGRYALEGRPAPPTRRASAHGVHAGPGVVPQLHPRRDRRTPGARSLGARAPRRLPSSGVKILVRRQGPRRGPRSRRGRDGVRPLSRSPMEDRRHGSDEVHLSTLSRKRRRIPGVTTQEVVDTIWNRLAGAGAGYTTPKRRLNRTGVTAVARAVSGLQNGGSTQKREAGPRRGPLRSECLLATRSPCRPCRRRASRPASRLRPSRASPR